MLQPMLFTGRLGKRVQHHRRGGRLVEEVQRLEEDGYQVLLRGGGKYFWFEHKCKAICLLHKTTQLIKGTLVLSPKAERPTHGRERRMSRRGRRAVGFISVHIIPRPIKRASRHFRTSLLLCSQIRCDSISRRSTV